MFSAYPTALVEKAQILQPDGHLGERADEVLHRLRQVGLVGAVDLTPFHAGTFAAAAAHPSIAEQCPGDIARVGTPGRAATWMLEGRGVVGIYAAQDEKGQPIPSLSEEDLRALDSDNLRMLTGGWSRIEYDREDREDKVTTAYRVFPEGSEAGRRHGIRMGVSLGELLLGATVGHWGARADRITLKANKSNTRALGAYQTLGFTQSGPGEPTYRPTLRPIGEYINGRKVRGRIDETGATIHEVYDVRLPYLLTDHPLLSQKTSGRR